jgi:hypothetical protein
MMANRVGLIGRAGSKFRGDPPSFRPQNSRPPHPFGQPNLTFFEALLRRKMTQNCSKCPLNHEKLLQVPKTTGPNR